jgi:hypothetical protein
VCLLAAAAAVAQTPDKVVPAINEIPMWEFDRGTIAVQVGQQPYEMTWVQRREDPRTLVDFEDLSGWQLELYGGASGELRRTREQQMWGQYVAKILYSNSAAKARVVARPPKPIPIPAKFDSADLWGYADRRRQQTGSGTPVHISILVRDARNQEHRIHLNDVEWMHWWLVHRRVPSDTLKQIVWPASFSGIEITMETPNPTQRYFYCDSLAFYVEELKPLSFQPQPKRNLKPFRGQIVGLNTGEGTLPFPTREETILPANFEKDFQTAVREVGRNHYQLQYKGRDATITYEYKPKTGNLSELTASVNAGTAFRPMDGGGVRFPDTPEGKAAEGKLVSASLDGDTVKAKFAMSSRIVDVEMRLWQKSLVLDAWCDDGQATELSFGRVAGVANPKPLIVPYITYGATNPRILMSGAADKPLFTSVWWDWYRTNASEPYSAKEPAVTADGAEVNGGLRYIAKTDGQRNNLYERIFVTVSPVYEETLPTIANPPSLRQEEGKQVVWTVTAPPTFQSDHQRSRRVRSYGLDKIMQHSHEVTWRDHADSFTMRIHAAPQKGGDEMLKWYIKAQKDLGWTQGVYTNYCDFAPVNTNWSPDHVQRTPDGEWRHAWWRNYALKPAKAVEFDEYYAKRIKEKFGVRMSYTDVHTAVSPWRYCDFDARVPGSGTMAATFYAYGQLLLNDQRVYGPTQSEGTYQWLYAGLTSGSYGWVYTDVNLLIHPLDVAFMLHKLHPLECDYGMGSTEYYLSRLDEKWAESPKLREYLDLSLATTIAYGNMGWLATVFSQKESFNPEALARSYYMMQQAQQQYAVVRPKTIEYADGGGRMLTPSQAHATGAINDSHLHVEYANGTQVYVNRSKEGSWAVKDGGGKAVELPPSGWLVYNVKNGFHEVSANVSDRRIDHVKSTEFEFLDGRGQWTEQGSLGATGSVARRERATGVVELIDIYGNDRIAFEAKSAGTLMVYDPDGKSLGTVEVTSPRAGWYEFKPIPGGRMYLFAAAP